MRVVDTNVLVRLIVRDDPKQVEAAESFIAVGAWVPHLAVAETACVLSAVYDLPPSGVATAIEMLLHHRQLTLQDEDVVAAALDQFRKKPSVGFSDCLMLAIATRAGHGPLATFDRDFGKIEGTQRL